MSDKILMQQCDFLCLPEPRDIVLACRGFTIAEGIALFGAKLEIPEGKSQPSQREVETSQHLSRAHIHVECVISQPHGCTHTALAETIAQL